MYGRVTEDDKNGIVAALHALKIIKKASYRWLEISNCWWTPSKKPPVTLFRLTSNTTRHPTKTWRWMATI
jgi:hypothetical protein